MKRKIIAVVCAMGLVSVISTGPTATYGQQTEGDNGRHGAQPDVQTEDAGVSKRDECEPLAGDQEFKRQRILENLEFMPPKVLKLCLKPSQTAETEIDPHRSLFVHDRATLDGANFRLERTLGQIAAQVSGVAPGTTGVSIFRQFWDTQNPAPGATTGPHCTDNGGTVNGYPYSCRQEGQEGIGSDTDVQAKMQTYQVLSLVNRLDLAHEGWRNCGEYRIIYGKKTAGFQRNLIIFEAVLPNPKPGCREGCLKVAQFWKSLSTINDPNVRAQNLEEFFYQGLPGYRPVVHVDHYSAKGVGTGYGSSGSGQIRTNQFLQQPWILKEFKTLIDCGSGGPCQFVMMPIMVKVNPHGELWNEDIANNSGHPHQTRAAEFQSDVITQIGSLASANLMGITYSVKLEHDAAQSISQAGFAAIDHYRDQFGAATESTDVFRTDFAVNAASFTDASGTNLTSNKIINRALTQSCAGCHMPSTFGLNAPNSIGLVHTPTGGTINRWPDALSFVHVDTPSASLAELADPTVFGSGEGHRLSPALLDFFLPARKEFLLNQLNLSRCLCRHRFNFLDQLKLKQVRQAERQLEKRLERQIQSLNKERAELSADRMTRQQVEALDAKITALLEEQDRQMDAELKKLDVRVPTIDLKPQPLKLEAAKKAEGDRVKESELRHQEVMRMLKQDPPRRTVTGSFRVH